MPSPSKTKKRKRSSSSTSSSPFNLKNYIESTKQVDEELGPPSQAHKKNPFGKTKKRIKNKHYRKKTGDGPNQGERQLFRNAATVHAERYGRNLREASISLSSSPRDDPARVDFVLDLPRTRKPETKKRELDNLKDSSYSPISSNSPSHEKPRLSESPLSKSLKPPKQ